MTHYQFGKHTAFMVTSRCKNRYTNSMIYTIKINIKRLENQYLVGKLRFQKYLSNIWNCYEKKITDSNTYSKL